MNAFLTFLQGLNWQGWTGTGLAQQLTAYLVLAPCVLTLSILLANAFRGRVLAFFKMVHALLVGAWFVACYTLLDRCFCRFRMVG